VFLLLHCDLEMNITSVSCVFNPALARVVEHNEVSGFTHACGRFKHELEDGWFRGAVVSDRGPSQDQGEASGQVGVRLKVRSGRG
jgi:hypothetical protein